MTAGVNDILNDLIARVGRVRRWLLALSALRSAALGLACVSVYIGSYAWLDHHVHFGTLGRALALALFLVSIGLGVYFIVRVLRRDMTYANAANYIESRRSFDQQLVAAVEYYEGRSDYPYSEALAGQLVRRIEAVSRTCRFDATVAKWQGYLLSAFVLLCIGVVGLFVRQNVLFFSSYLGRLLCPFSAIRPVPAVALESTTGDLIAGVDAPVTLDVAVQGRTPESVTLVLTRIDPNDPNESSPASERIDLAPAVGKDGRTRFQATKSFDAPGSFRYHFETPDARSDAHVIRVCDLPAIESIRARITPPSAGPDDPNGGSMPPMQPYEEEWTGGPLAVLPHSRIVLTAQATTPLREATVVGPDGQTRTQSLNGADRFDFEFTADDPSSLRLSGVSTEGLASGETKELHVVLKSDEAPQFRLVSPEGDYLATDVASIPIVFEVTDDFGLASAELICELPGREPTVLESTLPEGARQLVLTHTLELEQYDLHVGDSILVYAGARDIDTGRGRADANACSEVYFIEIRPYRQYWHPQAGSSGPSNAAGPVAEDLITILEYTRAVVKKTWTLARTLGTAGEDQAKLEALSRDVRYCSTRLVTIRDDPEAGFNDGDKAVMNAVLKSYEQAGRCLEDRDADAALPPEQEAYRILRMFIDELHMKWSPPDSGQSAPQETPERVKLQEQPQEPRMEAERVESRLREMQQKIESLARQQQALKADAAGTMQQEKNRQANSQASQAQGDSGAGEQGEQAGEGQGGNGRSGQEGQKGRQGQSGDGPGRASAQADARMRMLQARQKALREQASQLSGEMGDLPASEYSAQGRAKQQAQGHLDGAVEAMQQFEERLADARYEALDSSQADDMTGPADSASGRLADAGQAIRQGLSADGEGQADRAQEMAEQLAKDAEAYDESLSAAEKQKMMDRLKAAQQLLESMAGVQWTTISSGGGPGMSNVYTKDGHATAADTARLLARQFWSVALEAKKRPGRPVEQEASDVEFFEAENDFFEEAARFGSQDAKK